MFAKVKMNGEERTTKYAKGAKREAKLLSMDESQSTTSAYFAHFVVKKIYE